MSQPMRLTPHESPLSAGELRAEREASIKRQTPEAKGVSLKDPNWIDGRDHFRREFAKFTGDGNKPKTNKLRKARAIKRQIAKAEEVEGYVPPKVEEENRG